jgi:plasmid stabilization system protein ParE
MLARHPHIGREGAELRDGLRSWPVYPYIAFHRIGDEARAVIIERVIHGSMDIDSDDVER